MASLYQKHKVVSMSNREIRVSNGKILNGLIPKFDALKSQHGFKSDGEVIEFLLAQLEKPKSFEGVTFSNTQKPAGCNLTELELVDFVTKSLPIERLIYKGVIAESKRIYSQSVNEKREKGTRIESLETIHQVVTEQMAINQQGSKTTQRFISGAWIQSKTHANYPAIKEYLSIHQSVIDVHHSDCSIDPNQNRTALHAEKRARKEAAKTVEE
jgi:hypothetical protein